MWAQVSNEELCWHMNMANMNARIMRNMIKFILENDTDGKFSHFLDLNKGQFEMWWHCSPANIAPDFFSVSNGCLSNSANTQNDKAEWEYEFYERRQDSVSIECNAKTTHEHC